MASTSSAACSSPIANFLLLPLVPVLPGAGETDLSLSETTSLAGVCSAWLGSSLSADVRFLALFLAEVRTGLGVGDSDLSLLLRVDIGVDLNSEFVSLLTLMSELSLAPRRRVLLVERLDSLLAVLCCDSVDSLLLLLVTLAGRGAGVSSAGAGGGAAGEGDTL